MATIRKRPNGTYEIKVSCGYGVDGKQRNQYKSYKPEPGMTLGRSKRRCSVKQYFSRRTASEDR